MFCLGLVFVFAITCASVMIGVIGCVAVSRLFKSNLLSRTQLWLAGAIVAVTMLGAGVCYAITRFH
jgi:hypothetical protein